MMRKGYPLALAAAVCGLLGLSSVRADGVVVGCGCVPACCDKPTCQKVIEPVKREKHVFTDCKEEFCLPCCGLCSLFSQCCPKPCHRKYLILKIHKYEVCCPKCVLVHPGCGEHPCEGCGHPGPVVEGHGEHLPPAGPLVPSAVGPAPMRVPAPTPIPAPTPLPKETTTYSIAPAH